MISQLTIELAAKFIESKDLKMKKMKVHQFNEVNKFKVFIEVEEQDEAVKIYDMFFKGKFDGVKSSVYLLVDD